MNQTSEARKTRSSATSANSTAATSCGERVRDTPHADRGHDSSDRRRIQLVAIKDAFAGNDYWHRCDVCQEYEQSDRQHLDTVRAIVENEATSKLKLPHRRVTAWTVPRDFRDAHRLRAVDHAHFLMGFPLDLRCLSSSPHPPLTDDHDRRDAHSR